MGFKGIAVFLVGSESSCSIKAFLVDLSDSSRGKLCWHCQQRGHDQKDCKELLSGASRLVVVVL